MKCPYILNEVEDTRQHDPKNIGSMDEQTDIYTSDYTVTTLRFMRDCIGEECAAWQDGQCSRRA